jgi:tetratricopeptide (TPR) repeat protein
VLARQAQALVKASRVRAARASAESVLAVALQTGARREEGWALLALGTEVFRLGERDAGLAHLRQARTIAEELGEVELLALTFVYLPWALKAAGRLADALAEVLEGIETDRRLGLERFQGTTLATCSRCGPEPSVEAVLVRCGWAAAAPDQLAAAAAVSVPPRSRRTGRGLRRRCRR